MARTQAGTQTPLKTDPFLMRGRREAGLPVQLTDWDLRDDFERIIPLPSRPLD